MKPKAIFFDVDGTIIPLDVVVKTFQSCCRQLGVRVLSKDVIIKYSIGYSLSESVPKLLPEVDLEKFRKCFLKTQIKNFKKFAKILPFVKSTFNFINKNKIKIGVITTKRRSEALAILKGYSLPYNTLVAGDDVKNKKPHPEAVLKACENLNLNPNDCIFIGDHPFDMLASKSAGCSAVGVLTGWGNRKNLKNAGADYIIKDLRGLKKLIE
jgi:pyrophosphatase PpaX